METPKTLEWRDEKPYGWGWRHIQVGMLFLGLCGAYLFRINLSICLVEMTNVNATNKDFPIYPWPKSEKDLILSSFFWGYIITQVPAGILAAKFGPKWFLFGGLVGCSLLSAITPLVAPWGWEAVLVCRMLQGLVQGFIYPSTHTMLSRWSPPLERARHSSFVYNGISVGTVASMAGSGALAGSPLGWPSGFWVFGIIGLLWGLAWAFLGANSPATCTRINRRERAYIEGALGDTSSGEKRLPVPWFSILTSLPMWAIIIVHMGQNFGHWVLMTEMPEYMKQVLGYSIEENGIKSSLPYICLGFSSFFVSWFSQVVVANKWLSTNMLRKVFQSSAHWGSGTMLLVLALVDVGEDSAITLLCLAVGLEAGTLVGYLCNHMDLSPNFSGAMMGVTNGMAAIIALLAPILVGAITGDEADPEVARPKWNIVFILSACVYYAGNLFWVIFGSTEVQPWNSPAKTATATATAADDSAPEKTVKVAIGDEEKTAGELNGK